MRIVILPAGVLQVPHGEHRTTSTAVERAGDRWRRVHSDRAFIGLAGIPVTGHLHENFGSTLIGNWHGEGQRLAYGSKMIVAMGLRLLRITAMQAVRGGHHGRGRSGRARAGLTPSQFAALTCARV